MEWTLDQDRLYENPLLTEAGQAEIRELCQRHGLSIPSLTGDCFMQAPLWKVQADERAALERDFREVAKGWAAVGIFFVFVHLVEHGRLETAAYGARIIKVHVKDHVLGGTTVPLGTGNADFETVFAALAKVGFTGNCILQTARAADGDHAGVLSRYRGMTIDWLNRYAA